VLHGPEEPGKPLTLTPGGYQIMLMELEPPLKQGQSFPLTLTFEHAASVMVQAKVADPDAPAPMQSSMSGMHTGEHTP